MELNNLLNVNEACLLLHFYMSIIKEEILLTLNGIGKEDPMALSLEFISDGFFYWYTLYGF